MITLVEENAKYANIQVKVHKQSTTHFFANIQQRFVKLLVHGSEDVKMQNKQARDSGILVPLVNL